MIRLLLQKSEYQEQALEIARLELDKREIETQYRLEIEHSVVKELELEAKEEKEKEERQNHKIRSVILFFKSLNPIQSNASLGYRLFLFVGLIYLILYAESFITI